MIDLNIPILFIPGVLGTTLVDSARQRRPIWGTAAGLLASRRLPAGGLAKQTVEPGEVLWQFTVIPRIFAVPVYETLARRLESAGYRRESLDNPRRKNGLYGLAYDWRQDIVTAARAIDAAISRLRDGLGVERVHLVAHSWGCNAVRYLLRYGSADVPSGEPVLPSGANVASFSAIGPLYGGTWQAIHEAQHGVEVALGLGIRSHLTSTIPSLYQLLPYGGHPAVSEDGAEIDIDIGDIATWTSRRWGAFRSRKPERTESVSIEAGIRGCLSAGRRVWELLETPSPIDREVPTTTYAVQDRATLSRLVIDREGQPLACAEAVKRRAPRLLAQVTAEGDQYVTFEQIRRHTDGTALIGVDGCTHRQLCNHDRVLTHLVKSIEAAA